MSTVFNSTSLTVLCMFFSADYLYCLLYCHKLDFSLMKNIIFSGDLDIIIWIYDKNICQIMIRKTTPMIFFIRKILFMPHMFSELIVISFPWLEASHEILCVLCQTCLKYLFCYSLFNFSAFKKYTFFMFNFFFIFFACNDAHITTHTGL